MASFQCTNCGSCCGPVPVNNIELQRIKKKLSRLPKETIERLKKQMRGNLTCMFRDIEKNECSIYAMRPEICKMFGRYEGLVCPKNKGNATIGRHEGVGHLTKDGKHVGILTIQINWDNIFDYR